MKDALPTSPVAEKSAGETFDSVEYWQGYAESAHESALEVMRALHSANDRVAALESELASATQEKRLMREDVVKILEDHNFVREPWDKLNHCGCGVACTDENHSQHVAEVILSALAQPSSEVAKENAK